MPIPEVHITSDESPEVRYKGYVEVIAKIIKQWDAAGRPKTRVNLILEGEMQNIVKTALSDRISYSEGKNPYDPHLEEEYHILASDLVAAAPYQYNVTNP